MRRDELCDHLCDLLAPLGAVTYRAMFGGFGVYLDGVIFALVDDGVLYLKTDDETRRRHEERGCGPFRPYPDRDVAMGYHEVPAELLDDADELCDWARAAQGVALRARARRRPRKGGRKA
jgi:DNA transformation protein